MRKLCIILIMTLGIPFLTMCVEHPTQEIVMQDGEYVGLGEGRSGMIKVGILVKNHIITAIRILSQSESKFAQPAEQEIIDKVLERQTTEGIDAITGATLTSNGMLTAIAMAIDASKGVSQTDIRYTDTSCDVVVVGAGGAGLAAATQAASMGSALDLHDFPLLHRAVSSPNINRNT